jgi:hypothetical protein
MSDNIKNMEASVRARLLNIAKEEKLNFDFILMKFSQVTGIMRKVDGFQNSYDFEFTRFE